MLYEVITDEINSSNSKKFLPKIVTSEYIPKESEQITPNKVVRRVARIVATFLFTFNSSVKYATTTSKIEIADVKAAMESKRKNKIEKNVPPAMV